MSQYFIEMTNTPNCKEVMRHTYMYFTLSVCKNLSFKKKKTGKKTSEICIVKKKKGVF